MQCPICPADVADGSSWCEYCLVAVRRDGDRLVPVFPEIRPGEVIFHRDYVNDPPAGERTCPEGFQTDIALSRASYFLPLNASIRDACVRAYMRTDTGGVDLELAVRLEQLADATTKYSFDTSPANRRVKLSRYYADDESAGATNLTDWKPCEAVEPVGSWNLVEIRMQGPTLEGWVNNQKVAVAHDPVLGFGRIAIGLQGRQAGTVTVHSIEVRTVIP